MLIPNGELAVVDIRKLRDYCLNLNHDVGKHKARLFLSILGMNVDDAKELRKILLEFVLPMKRNYNGKTNSDSDILWIFRSNGKIKELSYEVAGLSRVTR